ncbi:hypothetical protein KAR91_84195 [Candidatus Pacearchaeota archaeon]|nr:hypothetical protein [Candidatus Pacearchaeota archaeon]
MSIVIITIINSITYTFTVKSTNVVGDNDELEWEALMGTEIIDNHLSGIDEAMGVVSSRIRRLLEV